LWPFGIFYGHLVCFMVIWYIFSRLGILYHEKSGNRGFKLDLWKFNRSIQRKPETKYKWHMYVDSVTWSQSYDFLIYSYIVFALPAS
jgi:hypothetical protein